MDKVEIPGDRQADKLKTMDEMENDFHLKKNNPPGGGGLCDVCRGGGRYILSIDWTR